MGGRGAASSGDPRNRYGKPFDISKYNINEKKFRPREMANLTEALTFMEKQFGDISDAAGEITKKYLGSTTAGLHDHGFDSFGRVTPRQTLFNTSGQAAAEDMVHELTHAVAEEMASNATKLGFKDRDEFYNTLRTEAYKAAGKEERNYDGRKWKDRAIEFPAIQMENVYIAAKHGYSVDGVTEAAMNRLKQYWKQYNRSK